MCLDEVWRYDSELSRKKIEKRGYGWKVFYLDKRKNVLCGPCYSSYIYDKRNWNNDCPANLGYYCFCTREGARRYKNSSDLIIKKVKIKNVTSVGTQYVGFTMKKGNMNNLAFTCKSLKIA